MPSEDLDLGAVKIVAADRLRFPWDPGAGSVIDLAADTVLIVDPVTHRPVALCRPLGAIPAAPPSFSSPEPPETRVAPATAAEGAITDCWDIPTGDTVLPGNDSPDNPAVVEPEPEPPPVPDPLHPRGPLTPAERERLTRLWIASPDAPTWEICAAFTKASGRTVSEATALKYREPVPDPPRPAEDPAPAPAADAPLAGGQRLQLAQLWRANPTWSPVRIADAFAVRTGRKVTPATALSYRPAAIVNGTPTPEATR